MKMKAMFASIAACAIAASALAMTASAEKVITNANEGVNYQVDVKSLPLDQITGIKAEITMADGWNESGAGGGIVFNADNKGAGWVQYEWGIDGEGNDCKNTAGVTIGGADGKFTITYQGSEAVFQDSDEWDAIAVAAWWGSDFTVDSLVALDKDGNEVTASAPSETTTTKKEEGGSTTTTTTTKKAAAGGTTTKAGATKTGDAGVGVAVSALSLAAVAAFAARKKH